MRLTRSALAAASRALAADLAEPGRGIVSRLVERPRRFYVLDQSLE